jgi:uncharacterized protein
MEVAMRTTLLAFALSLLSAVAAAEVGPTARTLTVRGDGEATAPPDLAVLTLAVITEAAQADKAVAGNAARTTRVLSAVRDQLSSVGRVTTAGYSLLPVYDPPAPESRDEPRLRGNRAENELRVEVRDLARVGAVIDAAAAAGANRTANLSFQIERPEAALASALADAGRRVRGAAEAAATALGVRLGRVVEATTLDLPRPRFAMAKAAIEASVPTPISPGEVTVRAQLTVTYAIE